MAGGINKTVVGRLKEARTELEEAYIAARTLERKHKTEHNNAMTPIGMLISLIEAT